jgi:hypothetical protein
LENTTGNRGQQYYLRVNADGILRLQLHDDYINGNTDIRDGQWHHVAGVRDRANGKLKIYIDGVLDMEGDDTTAAIIPTGYFVVGGFDADANRDFVGNIDFVKVTRSALTPAEFVQPLPLPSAPDPVDGATGLPSGEYILSWTPADGMISQRVLFGTDSSMQDVATVSAGGNTATVQLEPAAVYYWTVETQIAEGWYRGPVWSFSSPACAFGFSEGDLNGDCRIDLDDFFIMASNWLRRDEYEN